MIVSRQDSHQCHRHGRRSKRRVNVCLLAMHYRNSTLDKYLPPLRSIVVKICLEFSQIVIRYALIIIQSYRVSTMLKWEVLCPNRQLMRVHPLSLGIHSALYWRGAWEEGVCLVKRDVCASLAPQFYRTLGNPTAAAESGLAQTLASDTIYAPKSAGTPSSRASLDYLKRVKHPKRRWPLSARSTWPHTLSFPPVYISESTANSHHDHLPTKKNR